MLAATAPAPPSRQTFEALKTGLDIRAGGRVLGVASRFVPSGIEELDRALGGGFPNGAIGTLEGSVSSGRAAVAARLLARGTADGLAAVVDDGLLYPPHLAGAGVQLERLLIVHAAKAVEAARAADVILRARAFCVVVMPAVRVRATVWSRLATLAHKADALLVVIGAPNDELAYFATTRVRCSITRIFWNGARGPFGQLRGYEIAACVVKHRRAVPGGVARVCVKAAHVA